MVGGEEGDAGVAERRAPLRLPPALPRGEKILPSARRAWGAGELELRGEIEPEQAGGAAQRADEGGAGGGWGAGEDGLGAWVGQQVGELAGVGADVVVRHVAEPAFAAGEIRCGRALP